MFKKLYNVVDNKVGKLFLICLNMENVTISTTPSKPIFNFVYVFVYVVFCDFEFK